MTEMTPCDFVKAGTTDAKNFGEFLAHVADCKDCQRRVFSRIIIEFKQKQMEITNGQR